MPTFPELFILRHGETEWNAQGRMQGELNSQLTEKGHAQAAQQGQILAAQNLAGFACFSSPQGRAFQTAGIAAAPLINRIDTDDRLREIGVGDWQGKVRADLPFIGDAINGPDGPLAMYAAAPNGEGFKALALRCEDFLRSLTGPAVLVTHGITSRMLRMVLLGYPRDDLQTMAELPGGQGVVYHLKDGTQTKLV